MIEIEKKFQPSEENLKKLLEGAILVKDKKMTEVFYDLPDYSYAPQKILIRSRDGKFEMKTDVKNAPAGTAKIRREIEDEKEILAELGYSSGENLSEIINRDFVVLCQCVTTRQTYTKEGFGIDVDQTDFGYHICEIELLVEKNEEIHEAEEKINAFAQKFGLVQVSNKLMKAVECLRVTNPAVYEKIYGKQ